MKNGPGKQGGEHHDHGAEQGELQGGIHGFGRVHRTDVGQAVAHGVSAGQQHQRPRGALSPEVASDPGAKSGGAGFVCAFQKAGQQDGRGGDKAQKRGQR